MAIAAALGAECGRAPEPLPSDGRTAVPLSAEQRGAVLTEMRTLLASVGGVLDATSRWDTAGIRAAALRSGTTEAADPALEKLLPAVWMQMAMQTHQGFDRLAASVGDRRTSREMVIARLAPLVSVCVSCHATYRVTAP